MHFASAVKYVVGLRVALTNGGAIVASNVATLATTATTNIPYVFGFLLGSFVSSIPVPVSIFTLGTIVQTTWNTFAIGVSCSSICSGFHLWDKEVHEWFYDEVLPWYYDRGITPTPSGPYSAWIDYDLNLYQQWLEEYQQSDESDESEESIYPVQGVDVPYHPALADYTPDAPPSSPCGSNNHSAIPCTCEGLETTWLQVVYGSLDDGSIQNNLTSPKGCWIVGYQYTASGRLAVVYNPGFNLKWLMSKALPFNEVSQFDSNIKVYNDIDTPKGWDRAYWNAIKVDVECRGWQPGDLIPTK